MTINVAHAHNTMVLKTKSQMTVGIVESKHRDEKNQNNFYQWVPNTRVRFEWAINRRDRRVASSKFNLLIDWALSAVLKCICHAGRGPRFGAWSRRRVRRICGGGFGRFTTPPQPPIPPTVTTKQIRIFSCIHLH